MEPLYNTDDDRLIAERTIDTECVFDGRLLHVERATVELPNGAVSTREMIRHVGASAIVTLDAKGRVVLERQWRAPLERAFWEIPAGKLDPQEPTERCAVRELREETGITARDWVELGTIHNAIGYSDERIVIYLARDLDESGEQSLDDNEFLTVVRVTLEEALAMTRDGRITDVKSIIGLNWAEQYLAGTLVQARSVSPRP